MQLDENSGIPLYYQLKEELYKRIKDDFKIGEAFPTEMAISEEYGVSRSTVRQALQELVREGLIYRKQGKGTFVSPQKIIHPLGQLSFYNQMKAQGLSPSSQVLLAREYQVNDEIRSMLKLNRDMPVYKIVRLHLANYEPIILETSLIPHFVYPELLQENLNETPYIAVLVQKHSIERIDTYVQSSLPTEREREALKIESSSPVTSIDQLVQAKNFPVALICRIVRGDRCKYHISFKYKQSNNKSPVDITVQFYS